MNPNILLMVASLFYLIFISIMYFSKENVNTFETKIYKYILIFSIFGVIMDMIGVYVSINIDDTNIIRWIVLKLYYSYLLIIMYLLSSYMFISGNKSHLEPKEKRKFKILTLIFSLTLIIDFILPVSYYKSNNEIYAYGIGTDFLYIMTGLVIISWVIFLFKDMNINKLKNKKYIPMIVFILLVIPIVLIQMFNPELLLVSGLISFIVVIMYHTIENPDLKMIQQLELARNHAEKANRAKSDFLSSMSHEIRTPLNAIVGLSEDIDSYKDQVPKEVVEDTEDILNASQTLLEIVGNILDINKIESAKMEIVENIYNLEDEVRKLCKVTTTRIGEKNIKFNLNIALDIPYELIGDKTHVKQIINNLLSNAIKYTEQGEINLNIKCVNDINKNISNIIISCQDTGRGIKPELINKLFNKFERLDIEKNTTTEGTGLGLAITKSLVDMMGGKINVNSQFGKGSIFMVTIPQKISKLQKPISEKELINTMTNLNSTKQDNVENLDYGNKKVLIVDDNNLNIKVARRALSNFNFEIDECYDGQQCLDKINSGNSYDLILMDIMMPNMSGETAIAKLKENPNFNTPVIALTADALSGAKEKYINEGFIDYIAKPFSKEQIKEKLDDIFKTKKVVIDKWANAPTAVFGNLDLNIDLDKKTEKQNNIEYLKENNIDVNHGIELLGDIEMYNETMNIFYNSIDEKISKIKYCKENNDISNYTIIVHGLKSDCKYLGILYLSDILYEHELRSKENDIQFINSNYEELINKINEVKLIIKKYLSKEV